MVLASYLLMGGALLLVMWRGLLPGLLCVCLGFLLTRALTAWIAAGTRRLPGAQRNRPAADAPPRSAQVVAAAVVMLMPLALLAAGLAVAQPKPSMYTWHCPMHSYRLQPALL